MSFYRTFQSLFPLSVDTLPPPILQENLPSMIFENIQAPNGHAFLMKQIKIWKKLAKSTKNNGCHSYSNQIEKQDNIKKTLIFFIVYTLFSKSFLGEGFKIYRKSGSQAIMRVSDMLKSFFEFDAESVETFQEATPLKY